jgi:hypothetical protein
MSLSENRTATVLLEVTPAPPGVAAHQEDTSKTNINNICLYFIDLIKYKQIKIHPLQINKNTQTTITIDSKHKHLNEIHQTAITTIEDKQNK